MSVLLEYECPCCGGKVEFDSTLQKMKCPYCDTTFDVEAMKAHEQEQAAASEERCDDVTWTQEKQQWLDEEKAGLKVYACKSCGGEIITDDTTAATHCPYCGNPVIMVGNLTDRWKPEGVIPFRINKQTAMSALKTHMSGKKLLDKSFITDNKLEEIKGVYVPFWLFDGTADGQVRYHATRVRSYRSGEQMCTETSHYDVTRAGTLPFQQIPVDGAKQIPNDLMESVEPFDFSGVVPFQTAYLSGFFADRYNVESSESRGRAVERAKNTILDVFEATVSGYDTLKPERSSVRLDGVKAQYVLCPMWLMTASYQGKNYLFAVNGQTGKIAGNMPLDQKADTGYRTSYTLGIGGALAFLSLLMFGLNPIVIGVCFFLGWLIASNMVDSMKQEVINVAQQTYAHAYTDTSQLHLRVNQERFLYSNVTRTPVGGSHGASPQSGGRRGGTIHRSTGTRPPVGGMNRPGSGASRPGNRPPSGGMGRSAPRPGGGARPGGGPRSGGGRPGGGRPGGGRRP